MLYADFVTRMQTMLATDGADADLAAIMPAMIEAAELRCFRDLDPIAFQARATLATVAGAQVLAGLPAALWILRRLTLAGPPRVALERRDLSYLDAYAPDPNVTGTPRYWALLGAAVPILAPTPGAVLSVLVDYTLRPASLAAATPKTWLADTYPDLMLYAAMIFALGYQKSYGGSDGRGLGHWDSQYGTALAAARIEESKKKGGSPSELPPTAPPSSGKPT